MDKYIYLFQTKEEFNQAIENNFTEPWVSYTKENDKVDYYKTEYEHKCEQYFTIEATQDGTTVYFRQSQYAVDDGLSPLKVEVSMDDGETWAEITAALAENDVPGAVLGELDMGEKILLRGRNEAYGYYSSNVDDLIDNCNFYADKPCYVYGNIMSLIGGDDFAKLRKVKEYAFVFFFSDYEKEFDWSWVLSKEEKILLPATILAKSCYSGMFDSCTSLVDAPELPATTMADDCYYGMFDGCTSLINAPKLPATILAKSCYSSMFDGCTSLINAPELPAVMLADGCYSAMFYGCTSLTSAPKLPAITLAKYCYTSMFSSCASLVNAPALPATTMTSHCYASMFDSCTSLVNAPSLPATTLVDGCYNNMFSSCTNLSYIKAMFTTTPGDFYTSNWVIDVKATGTFIKNSEATWNVTGNNGIPSDWTVETASA